MSDYIKETLEHKALVGKYMNKVSMNLLDRAINHDNSKFSETEKELYEKVTPLLKDVEYGSKEYFDYLELLGPAVQHHYQENSHHPEHYALGISGMNLFDVVEMLCDWLAAMESKGVNVFDGLETNRKRFNISDQLYSILFNTVKELKRKDDK